MRKLIILLLAYPLLFGGVQAAEQAPAYIGKRLATPEDTAALHQVLNDFALAIQNKDMTLLGSLVLHSRILFASPGNQAWLERVRKHDPHFDGIEDGGYLEFARFIATTPSRTAEKFYNVQITQDGPVAWVLFDYEFLLDGKVSNYGVEHWQLRKNDGRWKIFSVVWTSHDPPVP